jgi:hypothetical protein
VIIFAHCNFNTPRHVTPHSAIQPTNIISRQVCFDCNFCALCLLTTTWNIGHDPDNLLDAACCDDAGHPSLALDVTQPGDILATSGHSLMTMTSLIRETFLPSDDHRTSSVKLQSNQPEAQLDAINRQSSICKIDSPRNILPNPYRRSSLDRVGQRRGRTSEPRNHHRGSLFSAFFIRTLPNHDACRPSEEC